jgi:hypothetical protein
MLNYVNSAQLGRKLICLFLLSLRSVFKIFAFIVCMGAVGFMSILSAAINIDVPNSDFSEVGNAGSKAPELGVLDSYDEVFGSGPWSVDSDGLVGLLAPSAEITSGGTGVATVSGLVSAEVAGVVSTSSASVYQDDIGVNFVDGWTYTLTAEVTVESLITLDVLADSGVGIALKDGGVTQYATDLTWGPLVDLGVAGYLTATITYIYTADDAGDIGVDLYVGHESELLSIDALGAVSFDNVVLTAVPEPSAVALLIGMSGLIYVGGSRAKRAR